MVTKKQYATKKRQKRVGTTRISARKGGSTQGDSDEEENKGEMGEK